jgi:flagellum-specific peptidoglycan hydrolase FlgJ
MATFTDIYKQELKGKGVLNSLGTAALKRTREKLDIRNMLFGGSGAIAATGQKVFGKGYQAIQKDTPKKLADGTGVQSVAMDQLLVSAQRQETQLSIIAKNTMNGNAMARDINVMRQNIMKLVTMGGGKASRGADMFFKDAKARENEYESKFKKDLSPTSVKEEKEKSKSILGIVLLALGTLGTVISVALEKMRDFLGGIIKGLGKTIIDGIVSALTGLGILKHLPLPTPSKTVPTPGTPGKTVPTPGAPKPGAPKIPPAVVAGGVLARASVPVAAIAAVVTGVKIHDADKKEYLDLAKKKRDEGLTSEEEARIRKLSTISFRAAATQILNYDPIEGKASEAKTSGQIAAMQKREALKIGGPKTPTPEQYATGLDEEIRMARENLKKEEQAAKLTPNRPLIERGLTQQREKLQKLEQERNSKVNEYTQATSMSMEPGGPTKQPSVYNAAMDSQAASVSSESTSPTSVSTNSNGAFKNKDDFLKVMYPLAVKAAKALGGVDPNALLTQWGFESDWGSKPAGKYNYFGIKADKSWKGNKEAVPTHEYVDGQKKKMVEPFRSYNSPEEAVDDYVKFLKINKRYTKAGLFETKTPAEYFNALQSAGYATDPNYATKLTKATASTATKTAILASVTPSSGSFKTASLMPSTPSSGSTLQQGSSTLAAAMRESTVTQAPNVVVNAPPAPAQVSSMGGGSVTMASVMDDEFARRVLNYVGA